MSKLKEFIYVAACVEKKVCPKCHLKVPKRHVICPNCGFNPPIFGGFLDENNFKEIVEEWYK